MQKFLLSSIGMVSVLLISGAVYLSVFNSYQQVERQGRTGAAITKTPLPEPSNIAPTEQQVTTTVLAQEEGLQNPTEIRTTVTIFNRKDLEQAWGIVYGSVTAAPSVPVVDFTKNAVIMVMAGKKPSGGYKISYAGIAEDEAFTTVQFNETIPGEGCQLTTVMTSPFIAVQIPNTGKTFKTVFNTQQTVCN